MPRLTVSQVTGQCYYRSMTADQARRYREETDAHLLPVRRRSTTERYVAKLEQLADRVLMGVRTAAQ